MLRKDKSLALKEISIVTFDEVYDVKYLPKRFQKIVRKHRGKFNHFIKDFPMHKVEAKECQRTGEEKDIKKDLVIEKEERKVAAHYVVKKTFTI